jgi:type VI secretion system secreted protein VgrG
MGLVTPLTLTTPLNDRDDLRLVGFRGSEALSQLFYFELRLAADNRKEAEAGKSPGQMATVQELLGQMITIQLTLAEGSERYFHGMVNRVWQGDRDEKNTAYRLGVVPQLWRLSKQAQSRIFQQLAVPDILKKVLSGLDVSYRLQGKYEPRDYVVQYRETDLNFASRLMEEEGIFYFFKHSAGRHQMIVADTPQGYLDTPEQDSVNYGLAAKDDPAGNRVFAWEKVQELRAGKYTLWDHCFELPGYRDGDKPGCFKSLEGSRSTLESVQAGEVTHLLQVGGNDRLGIYDYPGGYAQRFDGVGPGGDDRADDLSKIYVDAKRTAGIRMEQEAVACLVVRGVSNCSQFTAGHQFTLDKHFNANGPYVLVGVEHRAIQSADTSSAGSGPGFQYYNRFTCIPSALPFRSPRVTAKPFVQGTQTAVVVGDGGEICTDKYGRVKVQFHWDREGERDSDSSCWVRVGTPWAGRNWGMIHIPRVGQEVIVAFEEGDPDRPIIIGSVYNYEMMPPYTLPDNRTQSGLRTRSSPSGDKDTFNELRFEDKKDKEQIYFQAQKDFDRVVKNNDTLKVGGEKAEDGSQTVEIWKNRSTTVKTGDDIIKLDQGKSQTEAMQAIELKVGQSSLTLEPTGITLQVTNPLVSSLTTTLKLDLTGISLNGLMLTLESKVLTKVASEMIAQLKGDVTAMIG